MITFKEYAKGKKKKYPNALCCRTKDKPTDYSKLPKEPKNSSKESTKPSLMQKLFARRRRRRSPPFELDTAQKIALFIPAIQSIIGPK